MNVCLLEDYIKNYFGDDLESFASQYSGEKSANIAYFKRAIKNSYFTDGMIIYKPDQILPHTLQKSVQLPLKAKLGDSHHVYAMAKLRYLTDLKHIPEVKSGLRALNKKEREWKKSS